MIKKVAMLRIPRHIWFWPTIWFGLQCRECTVWPRNDYSNFCSYWDLTFLVFLLETFRKKIEKFHIIWNSQPFRWVLRGYSGIANLASKCDCVNAFSFRDVKFFLIFQKFSKNLLIFKKFQTPFLMKRQPYCQRTPRRRESCLQIWMFNSF